MFNILLVILYIAEIIFFICTIGLVITLTVSIIRDVHDRFSNVAYIFSIIFGIAVIIFYIGVSLGLVLQTFDKLIPVWIKISGAGY